MGFDRLPLFVIMDLDLLRDCCKALDNLYAMITKKKSSQLDITLTTELLLFLISTIGLSAFDEHSIIKKTSLCLFYNKNFISYAYVQYMLTTYQHQLAMLK